MSFGLFLLDQTVSNYSFKIVFFDKFNVPFSNMGLSCNGFSKQFTGYELNGFLINLLALNVSKAIVLLMDLPVSKM